MSAAAPAEPAPLDSRSVPAPSAPPAGPVATDPAELQRLRAERDRLQAEVARLRALLPEQLDFRTRLAQAAALPAAERRSAGWRLGRDHADELSEEELLALLEGARDPAEAEVLLQALRGGAAERWQAAGLERVEGLLDAALPELRAAGALLLTRWVEDRVQALGRSELREFALGRGSHEQLERLAARVEAQVARGEEATLRAVGERWANPFPRPRDAALLATRRGIERAATHAGRLAGCYVLLRSASEPAEVVRSFLADDPAPPVVSALADALAKTWRTGSSQTPFATQRELFETLYAQVPEDEVRARLVRAWIHEVGLQHPAETSARLEALASSERSAPLRALMERAARALAGGELRSTGQLDEVLDPR